MLKEVALSNLRTLKAQQVFRLSSRRNQTIQSFKLVIKRCRLSKASQPTKITNTKY